MGSTRGAVPTPSADPTSHFFPSGKCEKPLDLPYPANRKTTMQDEELGYHAEQECQRSARQSLLKNTVLHETLLNAVLGVNRRP